MGKIKFNLEFGGFYNSPHENVINDAIRNLFQDDIDFDSFFGALAKIGYKGTITFESFSSTVVSPDLSSTLGIWRNLWTDNKSMAKSAREYIENKIITAHKN